MDSGSALPGFFIICDFDQRSEMTLSLTTKLAIIRGLGMSPTSRFRKSGRRPGLAERSICIYRCPACQFYQEFPIKLVIRNSTLSGAVALAEKFSQATAPKSMLFGVRDASDRCHPAFSAPFVRTLTDILRCLTKCSIRWFDQAKIIRFFSEGKGVFPFSLTVSYGGVC